MSMNTLATRVESTGPSPSELVAIEAAEASFEENLQAAKARVDAERQLRNWKLFGTVGAEFYFESARLAGVLSVNPHAECRRNVHATMLPF